MADIPASTATGTSLGDLLSGNSGAAINNSGESVGSLVAAIVAALASFGVQVFVFVVLRSQLSRIYRPKTYLVAERERVPIPPGGIVGWIAPIFNTPNLAFVQKCGLDAFYFLRYLQMCLKIFLPMALIVLPILLPLNRYSGILAGGLDRLSISNVGPRFTNRLWVHLVLAILTIIWTCFLIYAELRSYIRVRQAYLTSPQHRIRASATTVLVTGIPEKWLTHEALDGLYDVFPGGLKNIWINRDFTELSGKIVERNIHAKNLEDAETQLIKKCREAHQKKQEKQQKRTRAEKKQDVAKDDQDAERRAHGEGTSAGADDRGNAGFEEAMHEVEEDERRREEHEQTRHRPQNPKAFVGGGFDAIKHGLGTAGKGVGEISRGIGQLGSRLVGDAGETFQKVEGTTDKRLQRLNDGAGFTLDDEYYQTPQSYDGPPRNPSSDQTVLLKEERHEPLTQQVSGARVMRQQPEEQLPVTHSNPTPRDARYSPTSIVTDTTAHDSKTMGPSYDLRGASEAVASRKTEGKPQGAFGKLLKKTYLWNVHDTSISLPSPQPHASEEDPFDLANSRNRSPQSQQKERSLLDKLSFWKGNASEETRDYPKAYRESGTLSEDGSQDEPLWRKFIEEKDRETIRLPLLKYDWWPSLPFIGEKADKIHHHQKALAILNAQIEYDQRHPENFRKMGSAFIQFNNQVAAHMAVQSVSHHMPANMAPRVLEISPDDVLWENLAMKWWERCVRTGIVIVVIAGMIILFAIPVAFTGLLSKVDLLSENDSFKWLAWLAQLPKPVISIIQGVLPPLLLQILLALVPVIMRFLIMQTGVPTGNAREMGVQQAYFIFLWIQVFLVVTISGGLLTVFQTLANNPGQVLNTLATDLPRAANYFFSYLTIQALSNSAGALLQIGTLLVWFVLAPILDSTARSKYNRQTSLQHVTWGSFFPPFANFAVIGLIYSVISPLILVFMLIIFSLFWIVYRYNVLYVYQFRHDTGGLLFPTAVNQLFVGLYVEELCFIGYFFIKVNAQDNNATIPQGIIMIVVLVLTAIYQVLLNRALKPLYEYLPITLEDEAVLRDEKFERDNASRFAPLMTQDDSAVQDHPRDVEKDGYEMQTRRRGSGDSLPPTKPTYLSPGDGNTQRQSWARRRSSATSQNHAGGVTRHVQHLLQGKRPSAQRNSQRPNQDTEAQHTVADVLFGGFADELEDLSPGERDLLTKYAFQHSALRARRPIVWIPNDQLGVSVDEIKQAERRSTVEETDPETEAKVKKTYIAMSNKGTALDGKGRVVFRQSPPDFESVDLITL